MKRLLAIATMIAVLVLVTAAGFDRYTAATASTVTRHDADVNWNGQVNVADLQQVAANLGAVPPGARPVAEQNLDGNGNIRVAQQGVVDVNLISGGSGRVIQVLDNAPVGGNANIPTTSAYVDVMSCERLDLFATGVLNSPVPPNAGSRQFVFEAAISIDGVSSFGGAAVQQSLDSGSSIGFGEGQGLTPVTAAALLRYNRVDAARAPYVSLSVYPQHPSGTVHPGGTVSAWLYCS